MDDGSIKNVEDIKINDIMLAGGKVYGIGQALNNNLYSYDGIEVSGNHAIIENDKWIRVKDSKKAIPILNKEAIVYPIANENHLMIHETGLICADFDEIDQGQLMNEETRLSLLNEELQQNKKYAI